MNIYQDHQNNFNPFLNTRNTQNNPKLFESDEAFMLGNLFKELYMTYKGFTNYCIQSNNQRQKSLLEVQIYGFVAHEINLFLDIYPDNQRMIDLYVEYANKAREATIAFEEQFGPLTVSDSSNEYPFQWVQGPWPWEYQN